jgi:hypothetical protein
LLLLLTQQFNKATLQFNSAMKGEIAATAIMVLLLLTLGDE